MFRPKVSHKISQTESDDESGSVLLLDLVSNAETANIFLISSKLRSFELLFKSFMCIQSRLIAPGMCPFLDAVTFIPLYSSVALASQIMNVYIV